ncbi:dienelactone hydrolase [Croceicoccus estronivorus]|uniref:dienelactone hydrolase family protein n=1 Tax=Croceicoccus estronivorus TaxID=1172626 RepID=UPI00082CFC4C|nr:dienelactone hydrolase family protein [Croceicoccus estronivorus]OCC23001.1 dienelactone hydrolase [Croceicoccus estronivorus]
MCDKHTTAEMRAILKKRGLTRRKFAAMGTAAALAACAPSGGEASAEPTLTEANVAIPTEDGTADAFFVHPRVGSHPGIIMWPDVAGLRNAYEIMARRLAAAGYAVLVVNQYYRSATAPILNTLSDWFSEKSQARLKPMMAQIDGAATARDASAFASWLDGQDAVTKTKKLGTCGYCMGGAFTVRTAAAAPDKVGAACSFHGAMLVTDEPDSPHRLLKDSQAAFLFAIAQNDDARAPDDKDILRKAAADAGRPAEVEVYPADHGWCTVDAPSYDKAAAEKAWSRMLAIFDNAL